MDFSLRAKRNAACVIRQMEQYLLNLGYRKKYKIEKSLCDNEKMAM